MAGALVGALLVTERGGFDTAHDATCRTVVEGFKMMSDPCASFGITDDGQDSVWDSASDTDWDDSQDSWDSGADSDWDVS